MAEYQPDSDKLLDLDHCDVQPNFTVVIDGQYYCTENYRPNTQVDIDEYNDALPSSFYGTTNTKIKQACVPDEDLTPPQTQSPVGESTGIGATRHFFESNAVDRLFTATDYNNTYILNTNWGPGPLAEDKIRAIGGMFWTWNLNTNRVGYFNKINKPETLETNYTAFNVEDSISDTTLNTPFDFSYQESAKGHGYINIERTTNADIQTFLGISGEGAGPQGRFELLVANLFNQVITEGTTSKWFYDHTFKSTSPTRKNLLTASDVTAMYYDFKPVYNFYVPDYEYLLGADSNIRESMLPNMYVILSEALGGKDDRIGEYKKHINLNGKIKEEDIDFTKTVNKIGTADTGYNAVLRYKGYENIKTLDEGELPQNSAYYKAWAKAYPEFDTTGTLGYKYFNLLVPHTKMGLLTGYHSRKEAFPMFMEMEFSTPTDMPVPYSLSESLKSKDSPLYCGLMASALKTTNRKFYIEYLERVGQMTDDTGPENKERAAIEFDIGSFPNAIIGAGPIRQSNTPTATILGDECSGTNNLSAMFAEITERTNMDKILNNYKRTYKQMMEGKYAKTETIMYRIRKSLDDGSEVQNFYLPNSNDVSVHKFIDTQVKYGEAYTYDVFVWKAVYGTKYRYTNATTTTSDGFKANIQVEYEPSVQIVEVPYLIYRNKILDNPPLKPEVDIIPYHGINNKLMINLNSTAGQTRALPIAIENTDATEFASLILAQNKEAGQKIVYKSDDFAAGYKIYRLDNHPEFYSDFAGGLIRDIDSLDATAVSIDEKLTPNKKYWYTFRSMDTHDHFSNPTEVYQVEIVDDGSSIYPLIDVIELKESDTRIPAKSLKRLMQIVPVVDHQLLPDDAEDAIDMGGGLKNAAGPHGDSHEELQDLEPKIRLGTKSVNGGQDIWGKKFKIRLTSKKTGRKIDINVEFKNKHIHFQS